tara:strand:+ start:11120 stop:12478 length:1359 start_codon:yes stop_codon:yes gene_type:complete
MTLKVIILAAGKGSRMKSQLPKVLHRIAGKPMVEHVIDVASEVGAQQTYIVYGHGGDQLQAALQEHPLTWIHQSEQLGTGHAVQQSISCIDDSDQVLILYGDVPLITSETLKTLLVAQQEQGAAMLTMQLDDPTGYGRILYQDACVSGIVEEKDATSEQKQLQQVNTGIFAVEGQDLKKWLGQIKNANAQQEYYLTDIVALAYQDKKAFACVHVEDVLEVTGVNNRMQQAMLERAYQAKKAQELMLQGVTLIDPARIDVRGQVEVGQDVSIDANVVLEGQVKLGSGVQIGAHVVLKNCVIGDHVIIEPMSIIEGAVIGDACTIGPFARLRPGTHLMGQNRVGNFVEMKATTMGCQSKANHLTYLGDSTIGQKVNIGAGTITCNYDGAFKHQTQIEDDVFIGSGTQLIAPVVIKQGATVGAGSTISKDVEEQVLALTRSQQKTVANWSRPKKK